MSQSQVIQKKRFPRATRWPRTSFLSWDIQQKLLRVCLSVWGSSWIQFLTAWGLLSASRCCGWIWHSCNLLLSLHVLSQIESKWVTASGSKGSWAQLEVSNSGWRVPGEHLLQEAPFSSEPKRSFSRQPLYQAICQFANANFANSFWKGLCGVATVAIILLVSSQVRVCNLSFLKANTFPATQWHWYSLGCIYSSSSVCGSQWCGPVLGFSSITQHFGGSLMFGRLKSHQMQCFWLGASAWLLSGKVWW